jgi:septal ring factor EnvC (AmiA/AmiB activator)
MSDAISLELFNRRFEQLNEMHRELHRDLRLMADSMAQLGRMIQNLDRRISGIDQRLTDVKDELQGTIRMELGGAVAHLETRLEQHIDRRMDEFSASLPGQGFSED